VPLPEPLAGVKVSQAAVLDGVQEQPAPAETVNVPPPPAEGAEALVGEIV
jgi:hypothetical protein